MASEAELSPRWRGCWLGTWPSRKRWRRKDSERRINAVSGTSFPNDHKVWGTKLPSHPASQCHKRRSGKYSSYRKVKKVDMTLNLDMCVRAFVSVIKPSFLAFLDVCVRVCAWVFMQKADITVGGHWGGRRDGDRLNCTIPIRIIFYDISLDIWLPTAWTFSWTRERGNEKVR